MAVVTEPHGEHHRCARCEAVGRAEAEARLAALAQAVDVLTGRALQAEARVAALTADAQWLTLERQRLQMALEDLRDFASRLSASTEQRMLANKIHAALDAPGGA